MIKYITFLEEMQLAIAKKVCFPILKIASIDGYVPILINYRPKSVGNKSIDLTC